MIDSESIVNLFKVMHVIAEMKERSKKRCLIWSC